MRQLTFNSPHWLRKCSNCCRWIENDFSSIESICLPIQWMMATITDVDCNLSKCSVKYLKNRADYPSLNIDSEIELRNLALKSTQK